MTNIGLIINLLETKSCKFVKKIDLASLLGSKIMRSFFPGLDADHFVTTNGTSFSNPSIPIVHIPTYD